jgi:hypothetical protein
MANNEAKVIITAEDKTSTGINSATKSLGNFNANVRKVGAGMTVVGGAIVAGITSIINAGKEAEGKVAIFNTLIKNMGALGIVSKDKILTASKAVTKLGFDDETTAIAMAKLTKATGDVNEAIKLNNLIMDIARGKTGDYDTAQRVVTLALAGSTKEIRAMGIAVQDGITPLEVIAELTKTYGGISQDFSKTTQGSLEAIGMAQENLKEAFAKDLLPVLTELATKVSDIIIKVMDWAEAHPELTKNILIITTVIGGLLLVLGPLLIMLPSIITFFGLLSTPVLVIIGIITGLVIIVKNLIDIFYLFKDHTTEIWNGIVIAFKGWINAIVGFFMPLINMLDNIYNKIKRVASSVGGGVVSGVSSFIDNVKGGAGIVADFVTGKASGGSVSGGSSYIVGENGPEMFSPSSSGYITPNSKLAGAGGITINITGNTLLDGNAGQQLAGQIMKVLKQNLRI